MIDTKVLVELVAKEFPDLALDLEEDVGLECLQAATLRMRAQRAIDAGDLGVVERCFSIADLLRTRGNAAVQNAIHVSFLETLDFRGVYGAEAFSRLSVGLREAWEDVNRYMEQLLEGKWTRMGPKVNEGV